MQELPFLGALPGWVVSGFEHNDDVAAPLAIDRALAAACRRTVGLCFADARADMNFGPGAFEGAFMRWGGWLVQDGSLASLIET